MADKDQNSFSQLTEQYADWAKEAKAKAEARDNARAAQKSMEQNDDTLALNEAGLPTVGPLKEFAYTLIEENKIANGQVGLYIEREKTVGTEVKKTLGDITPLTWLVDKVVRGSSPADADKVKIETESKTKEFDAKHPEYAQQVNDKYNQAIKKAGAEFKSKLAEALEKHNVKLESITGVNGNVETLSPEKQKVIAEIVSGRLDEKLEKLGTSLKKIAENDGNKGPVTPAELETALTLVQTVDKAKDQAAR